MTELLQLLLAIEVVIFFTIIYYRWARTKSKAQKNRDYFDRGQGEYMSDKCEWKDGKFYPCNGFDPENGNRHHDGHRVYCRGCGKSIDKPAPEVIIRKSGGTWVARYEGVDYLCMRKPNLNHWDTEKDFNMYRDHIEYWKPISEIEITDEIAKLRCLVKSNEDKYLWTLWGVFQDAVFITHKGNDIPYHNHITGIRIANADDIG